MTNIEPGELIARLERLVNAACTASHGAPSQDTASRGPGPHGTAPHGPVRVRQLREMPGGVSSFTFAADLARGGEGGGPGESAPSVVLKVAPPGLPPVHNRDVLRQARIMQGLGERGALPVPRILLTDDAVPPLFVMDLVPGQAYEPRLDVTDDPPDAATVTHRALAAMASLAALQRADPRGLCPDEPVLGPAEELARWARLFETVPEGFAPGHERLHQRLLASLPSPGPSVIVHGDYRLANMLFVEERMAAVIDWEIFSVGDPRIDLAWMLMHTAPAHRFTRRRPAADVAAGEGMPSRTELLAAYRAAGGTAGTDDVAWFLAFSYYKVASTLAVIAKRNRKAERPAEHLLVAEESLSDVVRAGLAALERPWDSE